MALNADGTLQNLVSPPRPVLPSSETLPASAGRRFSANDVPYEADWVAPRRSAASVASPPMFEPLLPPVSRPTAPPPVTVAYHPASTAAAEPPARVSSVPVPAPQPSAAALPRPAEGDTTAEISPAASQPEADAKTPIADERRAAKAAIAEQKAAERAAKAEARADAKAAAAQARADERAAKADAKQAAKEAKASQAAAITPPSRTDVAARLGTPSPLSPAPTTPTPAALAPSTSGSTSHDFGTSATSVPAPALTLPAAAEPTSVPRSNRAAIIVIAAVVAIAVLIAAVVMVLANRPGGTGAAADPAIDPLVTAADLSVLNPGPWQDVAVSTGPQCMPIETTAKAARTSTRKLSTPSNESLLQVMSNYPDAAAANAAYQERLTEAGTCPDNSALVQDASQLTGLADSAEAVTLLVQGAKNEFHTVVIAKSGQVVNVFDAAAPGQVPVTTVADAVAKTLTRQCTGGTCPTQIQAAATVPAAGDPAGWLLPADLPRITPGVGRWTAHDWAVNSTGSQCEGMDLTKVSGTTDSGQRTLILTDDPKAPASFGIDQVTYTFADAKGAASLAATLTKNLSSCAKKVPTASVEVGADVKGVGKDGVALTGKTWRITHKTNTATFIYRVAVVNLGSKVVYLMATPTKTFDFTDQAWLAIAVRAGQRASQA